MEGNCCSMHRSLPHLISLIFFIFCLYCLLVGVEMKGVWWAGGQVSRTQCRWTNGRPSAAHPTLKISSHGLFLLISSINITKREIFWGALCLFWRKFYLESQFGEFSQLDKEEESQFFFFYPHFVEECFSFDGQR